MLAGNLLHQSDIISKWKDVDMGIIDEYYVKNKLENTNSYENILNDIFTGKNIFLTGAAGTGKSTFLKMLQSCFGDKNIVTLAPTGVAALNVGGQTIHSFFKFKTSIMQEDKIRKRRNSDGFKRIDLLVIDEISMVRADLFQAIDWFLRKNGKDPTEPFGGVQIIVIGDLYQLPPIVTYNEKKFFYSLYPSPFFFDTEAFLNGKFSCHALLDVHRQKDPFFINLLGRIRIGKIDVDLLSSLHQRHISNFDAEEITQNNPIFLTARNDTAEEINQERLEYIKSDECFYEGIVEGNFSLSEHKMPAPKELILKVGAKVMFTKNDGMGRWVNGSMGVVENLGEDFAYIRIGENVYYVEATKWEAISYSFDEEKNEWVSGVIGTYRQLPLTLAWAVTIHKSQGRSLDSCIITLDGNSFADGQVYVALSRCKSFTKLYLSERITQKDIRVSGAVQNFYRSFRQ